MNLHTMQLIFIIVLVVNLSGAVHGHPQAQIHRKARSFFHTRTKKTLPVHWDADYAKGPVCQSLNGAACDAKDLGAGPKPMPPPAPPKTPPQECPEGGKKGFPHKSQDCDPPTPVKEPPREVICATDDGCEGPGPKSDLMEEKPEGDNCKPDDDGCGEDEDDDEGDEDEEEGEGDENCGDVPKKCDTGPTPNNPGGPPGPGGQPNNSPGGFPGGPVGEKCAGPGVTAGKIVVDTIQPPQKNKGPDGKTDQKNEGSAKCGPRRLVRTGKGSMLDSIRDNSGRAQGYHQNAGVRRAPPSARVGSGPLHKRAEKKWNVESEVIRLKKIGVSGPVGAWVGRRRRSESESMALTKNHWAEPFESFEM